MKSCAVLIVVTLSLLLYVQLGGQTVAAQPWDPSSTSPAADVQPASIGLTVASDEATEPITFNEFPLETAISDQYSDLGILFSGDNPFISTDRSNPTSPVLSGSPQFRGNIEGYFVNPADGVTPVVVESFTLDAGYFDELASTRIEWFDPSGQKLGQRTNTILGIERFTIEGGNIASWRMSIIKTEPAGYAVDNISFTPTQASVLFREVEEGKKEGTWEGSDEQIPGFDHVGLHVDNLVYESHPGYPAGTYYGPDGKESVAISKISGVQAQHTLKTFEWDSREFQNSPVAVFESIPIPKELAEDMHRAIDTQIVSGAKFLSVEELFGLDALHQLALLVALLPESQKGANGSFTCVGIIEWAAEQAGHNDGQGFIYDYFESVNAFGLPGLSVFPLLSPELLNYSMKLGNELEDVEQWFQGGFDPVDFMITDPLGRKLGYTDVLGEKNELPHAFYPGNGDYEQFLIPNPVAGTYTVELFGLGGPVAGAMGSQANTERIYTELAVGELLTVTFNVEMQSGVPGDVNRDGCLNSLDTTELSATLNTFPNSLFDPADIDGNGIIEQADLDLLDQLIALNVPCAARPDLVVEQIVATEADIQVIIQNTGTAAVPAEQGFWVDLYIDPSVLPTQPNQIWNFLSDEGLVWGVDGDVLPMEPGEVITLTLGDSLYWPDLSNFSGALPAGTSVYVQVDSANTDSTYGGVLESHEALGQAYNNVAGPILAVVTTVHEQLYFPFLNAQSQAAAADLVEDTPRHTLPSRDQSEMEN